MTDRRAAILKKYTPITKAQLRAVVADYALQFPEWTISSDGMTISRNCGPIRQLIWFQRMSSASYRPTHGVNLVILTDAHVRMLPQVLDVKHREVEYRWHEKKLASTIASMEQQFRPNVRGRLDIAEVAALCEAEAASMPDTTNNMAMLAILSSWLGRQTEALDYCTRMQRAPLPTLAPIPEWDDRMKAFGVDLSEALKAGTAQQLLGTSLAGASDN